MSDAPTPPFPEQEQQQPDSEQAMDPKPDYGFGTYRGHGRLEGKAAIVTGGDSGIGRAVAYAFACEGADVVVSYLQADEDAAETARAVESAGRRCVTVRGDIGDEAVARSVVERCVAELGRLDVLVNNAAWQMARGHDAIEDHETEEIERIFRTNVIAMFHLVKAAARHLEADGGGVIINSSSVQSESPSPELLPYSSTKGAINTFTYGLATDLITRGIRTNAVAPGPVWTPLIPATMPAETVAEFGKQVAGYERPAQPAEMAPVYVFLASDESRWVNGQVIGAGGSPL